MKKINIFLTAIAFIAVGLVQSCKTDNPNDWSVDSSVTRQYEVTEFNAEVDSASLNIQAKIGTLSSAAGYQIQVSKTPLYSGYDDSEGIATFTMNENVPEFVIPRDNGQIKIENDERYYLRVRALGKDGISSSKWTTTSGDASASDAKVILCSPEIGKPGYVESAKMCWIPDAGVGETTLTITYYIPDNIDGISSIYCRETDLSYPTSGDEPSKDNVPLYTHSIPGLESGKEYNFELRSGSTTVATTSCSTELPVDMNEIMQIKEWESADVIGSHVGDVKTLTANSTTYGDFTVLLNEDNAINGGFTKTGSYKCWLPDNTVGIFPCRVQNKNSNTVDFICPTKGRIYIHGQGKNSNGTTYNVTYIPDDAQPDDDPIDLGQKTLLYSKTDNAQPYLKIKIPKPGRVHLKPVSSSSAYFYGFSFVPGDY